MVRKKNSVEGRGTRLRACGAEACAAPVRGRAVALRPLACLVLIQQSREKP